MDRRAFIAASASAAALSSRAIATPLVAPAGRWVTLTGWIKPAGGHYFVFSPAPDGRDPASPRLTDWRPELVRVFPKDVRAMRTGQVSVRGRLYRGKFVDEPTGHAAGAVLTDAVNV